MAALPCKADAEKLLPKDNPAALALYDTVVLPAEKAASEVTDSDATLRVVFSRVVGYLLLHPPSEQARVVLQSEIERCISESDRNQAVYSLGEMYVLDLILPFFTITEETTPRPMEEDSRFSYDVIREKASLGLLNSPQKLSDAYDFALVRDNFRCMVSHANDYFALQGGHLDPDPPGSPSSWTIVDCCHIFPEALENTWEEDNCSINIAKNHSTALWTILERFGYERIHNELKGTKIHRMENVMTLATSIHALFRMMSLWFEEEGDGQADCYHIGVVSPSIYESFKLPVPERIQFVANADLPLPDPTYLHIHASCCRVAHLSGAWSHLESIFWDEVKKQEYLGEDRA